MPLMIEDSRQANDNKAWFEESLDKIVVSISADADKADEDMEAQGPSFSATVISFLNTAKFVSISLY